MIAVSAITSLWTLPGQLRLRLGFVTTTLAWEEVLLAAIVPEAQVRASGDHCMRVVVLAVLLELAERGGLSAEHGYSVDHKCIDERGSALHRRKFGPVLQ